MKVATNSPLDKLLEGGLESDAVTNVYGPPGSGKTNVALASVLAVTKTGKAVYIDTEGSFSLERFRQMGGTDKTLKSVIMIDVHSWAEQHKKILELERIVDKEGAALVVVDSLVALYRLEMSEKNFSEVNKQLATQYSVFSRIVRKKGIPVLVTNQVYTAKPVASPQGKEPSRVYSRGDSVELTSREIARYWSKTLIELRKLEKENQRVAILRKHRSLPEGRSIEFEITGDGLKQIGRFSIM